MERDYCVHPGIIIKTILTSINKTQKWLADEMGINKIIVCDLIRGKRNVTANLACLFEKATGFKAELLLEQQNKYDLFILQQEQKPMSTEITFSDNTNTQITSTISNNTCSVISHLDFKYAA